MLLVDNIYQECKRIIVKMIIKRRQLGDPAKYIKLYYYLKKVLGTKMISVMTE